MTETAGRLRGGVGPGTRRIVYGDLAPADVAAELARTAQVDRAHVVMLAEQGLVDRSAARAVLAAVVELADDGFAALAGRPAPRGVFLMYESYLIERLGPDVGGVLHTGRSRNDLRATTTALALRARALELVTDAARLQAVLLSRARAHRDVPMPVYTHHQAAMPITYGYYLLGVARAVGRETAAMRAAADGFDVCPLGAAAVAGTDLAVDGARTARLLGFTGTTTHALDTLASRDGALRLLGAAAGLAVVTSRLAADLQLWSTAEFDLVRLPDRLVGGSSAMPQKRNAFLFEHVKAKAARVIGAWTGAAAAMKSAPFTHTIEVGTESVAEIDTGLDEAHDAVRLSQVLASGAAPVPERMRERLHDGFTGATAAANRLVGHGVAFRTAHTTVGEAVRRALADGRTTPTDVEGASAEELVADQRHGGGPGAVDAAHAEARADLDEHRAWCHERRDRSARAERELAVAVETLRRDRR